MTRPDPSTLVLRPMQDADWPAVEAGYAHSFMDCRAPQVWDWRFRRHDPQAWCGWVAVSPEGELACFIGASAHRLWLAGQEAQVLVARDHYSLPAWRVGVRQTPFVRTEHAFHAHAATSARLCLGMGLDRRVRRGAALGVNTVYTSGQWLQIQLPRAVDRPGCSLQVRSTHFDEPGWDRLWAHRRQRTPLSLVRDREFLAWRFHDAQGRTYWRFALHSLAQPDPLGYLVLTPQGPNQAVLVDAALPVAPQQVRDALAQVAQWLARLGVHHILSFMGPACPEFGLLRAAGFTPTPPPQPVLPVYRLYQPLPDGLDFERDYAFTLADSDLY